MTSSHQSSLKRKSRVVPVTWSDAVWQPRIVVRAAADRVVERGPVLFRKCGLEVPSRAKLERQARPRRVALCSQLRPFSVFVSSKLGSNGVSRLNNYSHL